MATTVEIIRDRTNLPQGLREKKCNIASKHGLTHTVLSKFSMFSTPA